MPPCYCWHLIVTVLFSFHIRSMWETICDAWASWSGWKFGSKFWECPTIRRMPPPPKLKFRQILALWVLTWQSTPPPPENWNLGRSWHFEFWLGRVPPPPKNWNLGRSWNFRVLTWQSTPPPPPLKLRQILALWVLTWQSTPHPPPPPPEIEI